jgi:hypothetical protein
MPTPPEGEADLRTLAQRYETAEGQVRELLTRAPNGDRRTLLTAALGMLVVLRKLDPRGAITTAYLHEVPFGDEAAVDDLAGHSTRHSMTASGGLRRALEGHSDSPPRRTSRN